MTIKAMTVSRGELAEFIGLGLTTVASFVARQVIQAKKDGKYDLRDSVAKIIKWQGTKIRNAGGAGGSDDGTSLTEARIAHTVAITESVALKTARQRGEV